MTEQPAQTNVISTAMAHLRAEVVIDAKPILEIAAINIGADLTLFIYDLDTIAHLRSALYDAELMLAR